MNIRTGILPCSLLLFACSPPPESQVAAPVQPASAPEEVVAATSLPEVRYYLIADT